MTNKKRMWNTNIGEIKIAIDSRMTLARMQFVQVAELPPFSLVLTVIHFTDLSTPTSSPLVC